MKKVLIAIVAISTVIISCKGEKKEKLEVKEEVKVEKAVAQNNVDLSASLLSWKGTKPGGAHNGTVALKESSLVVENGKISSGEFLVDMSSIKNLDIKSPEYGAKLVAHLSNEDFFDVTKYPTSKFVITSVEEKEGKLAVTGNLTIKDVTKSITIPATLSQENGVHVFKSETFNIDRADFNVKHKSKRFFDNLKDKFIDDLVEMSFEVRTKA
ncbi:YceI family protein [Pseudotenacibaculum sp. MALMAid0570]|uniref:YceI family protein n=1 Tax=Pseudotenacibaculum sp. MALMAid0570 TaxID=3143938 RepID=UPI0032E018E5